MAGNQSPRNDAIGFKNVQLFKDQVLGIGSYGKVCRAKCDDLPCAAKVIHETLFDPTAHQLVAPQREHRLPMRRFEQECQFLSTMRHPNIVRYLGIYQDPDTGLPVLLMELMDDSLTHFVESSTQPIPYHIQVNICHDIVLALSFLHSNDIVHRDLSSNNVLLIGNVRAKVTDFGMAKLGDQNPRATHLTFTMCPGTDVFMPPEAVRDKPVYTEKIDCFSFGVITLQMLTRKFPEPGDRTKEVEIAQPGIPRGAVAYVCVPEIERRQEHIAEVDPNHTLLQVTLDCLKDRAVERPSAQQLCERVAALKEGQEYRESVRAVQEGNTRERSGRVEREREMRALRRQHAEVVQNLERSLRQKDLVIAAGQQQIEQLEREKGQVSRQLEDSEQDVAQLQRRIDELEKQLLRLATNMASSTSHQRTSHRVKMTWKDGERALFLSGCSSESIHAVTDGTTMYIRTHDKRVYAYTLDRSAINFMWSELPGCPASDCPSAIINGLLTLIGGKHLGQVTNKLFSVTGTRDYNGRKWTENFPPMPTARYGSTALCTGRWLIVAGGRTADLDEKGTGTVEVMETGTRHQWYTVHAAALPQPVSYALGAVCGDQIYIMSLSDESKSIYTCSERSLLQYLNSYQTRPNADVWNTVAAPPVTDTTCVSFQNRLLTIGGKDSNGELTAAVHMYYPTTDSWAVVNQMSLPRCNCYAAVLPDNQLIVVGGQTEIGFTNSIEMATIH